MNTVCISTKHVYPRKVGDETQGVPSASKSRGNVPLSTHGPTPMAVVYKAFALYGGLSRLHNLL